MSFSGDSILTKIINEFLSYDDIKHYIIVGFYRRVVSEDLLNSFLCLSAEHGHLDLVSTYGPAKREINPMFMQTVLERSCRCKNISIFDHLRSFIDPEKITYFNLLFEAITYGNLPIVKHILSFHKPTHHLVLMEKASRCGFLGIYYYLRGLEKEGFF